MLKFIRIVRRFSSLKPEDIIDIGAQKPSKGILTICPTPIGNLSDWSQRQDQAVFNADVIACEDTRITGFLLKLIKKKENIQQSPIPEDPKDCDLDDDDFSLQDTLFNTSKELALKLPQLNKEFINESDFKFFKQKKIEEMRERISEKKKEQQQYLHDKDPLKFMGKEQEEEEENTSENNEEFEVYGITAPFLTYLKNKIAVAKKRKGRGVLISCHKFNEEQRLDRLVAILKMGLNVTLVCDAGTPAISDPGYKLVSRCIERNIQIESIPGSSAITVALSASGFPADQFQFLGFLSKQQNHREESLLQSKQNKMTTVLFESSNRVHQLLLTIEKVYGEYQQIWIGFELTKLFEKKMRGKCRDLYENLTDPRIIKPSHLKGEVTIIIGPYIPQYNDDLRAQQINQDQNSNQQTNNEQIQKEEDILIKKVDAQNLCQILTEQTKINNKELTEILQQSLRISKGQATKLVFNARHAKEVRETKDALRKQLGIENLKL